MAGELAAAKLKVMAAVPYVQKQHGQGLGYTFAGEAAFIDKLHPAMVAAGLTIAPEKMELVHQEVYTTAKGSKMNRVVVLATYRLTHAGSGESEPIQTFGEGADSGDKSVNKAMTGAYKYALRQAFLIETGNDPDETPSEQQQRATRGRTTTPPRQQQPASQPTQPAPRTAVAAGQPVPLTLSDIRARWDGAKVETGEGLVKSVAWLDDRLAELVAGYERYDLEDGLYQRMNWGDQIEVDKLGQSDLAAAKAFVAEYLKGLPGGAK